MKRFLLYFSCIMAIVLLSGCSMDNTPTGKVENFLDNYKNHDDNVIEQLGDMVNMDGLMDEAQKSTYTDIMKKQYEDLSYEIKNEVIDGDTATVTAEIEVYDCYRVNQDAEAYYNSNPGEFSDDNGASDGGLVGDVVDGAEDAADDTAGAMTSDQKYVEYRLGKLKEAEDRVTYTIDFTLTKNDEEVWTLNEIDDMTRQ